MFPPSRIPPSRNIKLRAHDSPSLVRTLEVLFHNRCPAIYEAYLQAPPPAKGNGRGVFLVSDISHQTLLKLIEWAEKDDYSDAPMPVPVSSCSTFSPMCICSLRNLTRGKQASSNRQSSSSPAHAPLLPNSKEWKKMTQSQKSRKNGKTGQDLPPQLPAPEDVTEVDRLRRLSIHLPLFACADRFRMHDLQNLICYKFENMIESWYRLSGTPCPMVMQELTRLDSSFRSILEESDYDEVAETFREFRKNYAIRSAFRHFPKMFEDSHLGTSSKDDGTVTDPSGVTRNEVSGGTNSSENTHSCTVPETIKKMCRAKRMVKDMRRGMSNTIEEGCDKANSLNRRTVSHCVGVSNDK
ncbi:hypothetical protein MMC25_001638 [Agyrium rufum]|nr:hypothetical protein [Agyrium rufum]